MRGEHALHAGGDDAKEGKEAADDQRHLPPLVETCGERGNEAVALAAHVRGAHR